MKEDIKPNNICAREPVFVVGPTASGKSEFAYRLAKQLDGVIISADSMQIYRGLNIGTAKDSEERRKEIPYKMVDMGGGILCCRICSCGQD